VVCLVGLRVEPGGGFARGHRGLLKHAVVDKDRRPHTHREVERVAWAGVEFVDAPVDGDAITA
jgi:hypothetical protein